MSKLLSHANGSLSCEKRNNSREFKEEEIRLLEKNVPKPLQNEAKQEYDFKDNEVEEIEKLTNSKVICNIGYGGFSTVKLIFNYSQKTYFAMKVVSFIYLNLN